MLEQNLIIQQTKVEKLKIHAYFQEVMTPEGGHIGFGRTIFIVIGLS